MEMIFCRNSPTTHLRTQTRGQQTSSVVRHVINLRIGLILVCLVACSYSGASAQYACNQVRPQDEYWEISTRCIACNFSPQTLESTNFAVSQMRMGAWQTSSFQSFLSSVVASPPMRTIIYTHGNWMTYSNSRGRAQYVYRQVSQRACEPIRFIAYTWPSERSGRPVQDIREKAGRSEVDAFYYAHLLNEIPKMAPFGLIGYSFGSRVTCGGVHLINGGSLNGSSLPVPGEPLPMLRISLIAPAFDRNWLSAKSHYGRTLDGVDKLVNLYNSRDPILRRFRFLDDISGPIAAGFAGITGVAPNSDPRSTEPLTADPRIVQFDCVSSIGNTHSEMDYYCQCPHFQVAIDNVLGK